MRARRLGGLVLIAALAGGLGSGAMAQAPAVQVAVNGVPVGPVLSTPQGPAVSLEAVARQLGLSVIQEGPEGPLNLERSGAVNPPPILASPAQVAVTAGEVPGFLLHRAEHLSNAALVTQIPGLETAIEDAGRLDGAVYTYLRPPAQVAQLGGPRELVIALSEFSTWAGAAQALATARLKVAALKGVRPLPVGRLGRLGDSTLAFVQVSEVHKVKVRTIYLLIRVDNWELLALGSGAARLFGARNLWPLAQLQVGKLQAAGGAPLN